MATLADAAVEIIAELDTFEPDLRRKLTKAVQSAADDAEREFRKAGNKAGKAFADATAKAAGVAADDDRFARAGRTAGSKFTSGFNRDAAAGLDRAQAVFAAAGRDAGVVFSTAVRRETRSGSTRAGQESGNIFSRAFETAASRAIGTGLLRVFAAGTASLVTAVSPLATILGGAAAAAVALAAALTQAAGAGIALGGVLGSVGLAAATVKVASTGLSEAFDAQAKAFAEMDAEGKVSKKTQEDLAAAMKNLAPAAREVVAAVGAQRGAWRELRQAVQQSLFAGVASEIQQLSGTFLPILRRQLTTSAGTINEAARAFVNFITSGEQSQRISRILTGLNTILAQLLPVIFPLAEAFLTLFEASLPFALQLATVLGGLAQKFAAFATGVVASGEFATFMKGAFEAARLLFGILGNIAGIITTVFAAGSESGVGLLSVIENLLGRFREFLASPVGQEALTSFFSLIGEAGSALIAIFATLKPVVQGLSAVFKALEEPIQQLGAALAPVIGTLAVALGDALKELAPQIAALVVGLTPLVSTIGGALVRIFAALLTAILPLVPVIVQLVTGFANALVPQFAAAGTILVTLVEAVGMLVTAFLPLLAALLPLIPAFAQLVLAQVQLQIALLPLVTQIAEIAAAFITAMLPAIEAVVPTLIQMIAVLAFLITKFAEVVTAVVDFVGGITHEFSVLIASGTPLITAFITAVTNGFARLALQVAPLVAQLVQTVLRLLAELAVKAIAKSAEIGRGIVNAIKSGLSGLANAFTSPFEDARSGVGDALQSILDTVLGFVDRISGAISRIGGLISNIPRPSLPGINLPFFGDGGLATRPSIAGEAGPEVVIPLNKPRRRDELLERYFGGWDGGGAYSVGRGNGRTKEVHMPVNVTGLSKDETVQVLEGVLVNRLGPHIGITTSGGDL